MNENFGFITAILVEKLKPYLRPLNLTGFTGIELSIGTEADTHDAQKMEDKIVLGRNYAKNLLDQIQNENEEALGEMVNVLHHEFCHFDIDNRMPFLSEKLSDDELWPMGLVIRFVREYYASVLSNQTMNMSRFRTRLLGATQDINRLSQDRVFQNYCDIVCNLSYILGDCRYKPFGYYKRLLLELSDETVSNLAENLFSAMIELHYPLKSISDTQGIKEIVETYCNFFLEQGGTETHEK